MLLQDLIGSFLWRQKGCREDVCHRGQCETAIQIIFTLALIDEKLFEITLETCMQRS